MKKRIYLDYSATTPMKQEVLDEMMPYFTEKFGNPSSIHSFGREAKQAIDLSRERLAKAIGAKAEEIFFTGGGSEADNWAIKGIAYANRDKGNHIITTKIEHHAVLHTCEYLEKNGFEVTYLDVDAFGHIKIDDLKNAITDQTILITIMFANNEIGTIQPIQEIGQITKEKKIIFHVDAVQAFGNVKIDVNDLNIDLMSLSAHKVYGPKGIGALYIRKGVKLHSLIHGGAQERRRRAGTENLPGIVGFGKAASLASENLEVHIQHVKTLRDKLIKGIMEQVNYVRLNGHSEYRLPGNVNFAFEFIEGESLLLSLDMLGIAGSSGSACTSGSLDPSHVLMSLGLTHEIAHGSLRLTIGDFTTEEDIDYVLQELPKVVDRLRQMSPLYEKVKGGQK
ncbi:cysteine desulfurase NifS [Geosporobacter ferrireducens]|uniref:Cysteine desulfurase IscS n=1 Tax=Geosporobacter ferrireducens TaxID=1424294 RepID=A0A1D8GPK9_9FIRM|nr:cysteine desulfurase NifS [Geosporobacter ferrireducens]AOT72852.1 cysteine desulfurase NifS [Geosporobacter ferrireducens]MTI55253.1 cysteine desulfurase NifS [Geosporobacter ferrireducens]